jgi:selenide,water dikinase
VDRLLAAWSQILADARQRTVHILTVGGGVGGVELTLAMHHRAGEAGARTVFCVVTESDKILRGHPPGARQRIERVLRARDLTWHTDSHVCEIDGSRALLADGRALPADYVIWATGASAPGWPREAGLATDRDGFVVVGETLQSRSHPEVFASGDVATMEGHPRPRSGVYAVRQGPPLARNVRRAATGQPLESYLPQRFALALISTGGRHAIASWGPLAWDGDWVWRWKDRIDRRFVARYRR